MCQLQALRYSSETMKLHETELAEQLQKAIGTITRLEAERQQPRPSLLTLLDAQAQASGSNRVINNATFSDVPSYMSPLPAQRKMALDSCPSVTIPPEDYAGNALFSRKFLSDHLGGGTQSLIVGCALSGTRELRRY